MVKRRGTARKPPYASPLAFRDFLERTRALPPPPQVDRNFLARLGIARNNEWSLTSALKFLGITDERGVPTHHYEELQGQEWRVALRTCLEQSYGSLLSHGGDTMELEDLRNYFRVTSTGAQALNAARFFRELRELAQSTEAISQPTRHPLTAKAIAPDSPVFSPAGDTPTRILLLQAKLRALELLPPRPPDWKPDDYIALFDRLLLVLKNLDET